MNPPIQPVSCGYFGTVVVFGEAHGLTVALVLLEVVVVPRVLAAVAALVLFGVAEVAEPGTAFALLVVAADPGTGVALAAVVELPVVVLIAGQGALRFTLVLVVEVAVVPVVFVVVADAGTFEFGFVVDVADAGVLPVVFVVPFWLVAGVAVLGVAPAVGCIPGDGWIPGVG